MKLLGLTFGRTSALEARSTDIDVGRVYASFFQFGASQYAWQVSPAVLAGSIAQDGEQSLIEHSRRLSRQSPLLRAYRRCMTGGILTGDPERPVFEESVPKAMADRVSDLWLERHDCEMERAVIHRLIVDGDLLLLEDGEIVPSDQFSATLAGPDWARRVVGWRIGKGSRARRTGLMYLGDRSPGETRAAPWQAGAVWPCAGLVNIRVAAAHGLGSLAKLAAVIEAASADRIAASAGMRSGLANQGQDAGAERQELHTFGVGSVPFMRAGEKIARVQAGPDAQAMNYESVLETEAATALNLPLSELKSDYSSGSFSNLRMAWQDADREYRRRRTWFHRNFRLPIFEAMVSDMIADGLLSGVTPQIRSALSRVSWPGPRREPPQPEKQYLAVAALAKEGLTPADANESLNQKDQ